MIFRQLFDAASCTYTYLVAHAETREALLIDPVRDQAARDLRLLDELDLRLRCALDTHIHADHVTALAALREATGCDTVLGAGAAADCVTRKVTDGETLALGRLRLRALYTPGHTDDSYCFVLPDRVFTGDTLLIRGTGRTDFQNGDPGAAYDSLFGKVLALPDATRVYPAHDYNGMTVSTIAEERRHNPRLQVDSREAYVALMEGLELEKPRLIDVAVPANRECGRA